MRRITAGFCLVAGVVSTGVLPALSEDTASSDSALVDQATLPDAIELKGPRPKADPSVTAPAADVLPPSLEPLSAPPSLALPDAPSQVRIHELRPLTLDEALQLAEFNSPTLKAAASQVDQAKSALRAAIAAWYPTVDFQANGFPEYLKSYRYRNPEFTRRTVRTQAPWVLKLAGYDFSTARGQLVMSRPCLGPQSIPPSPAWRSCIPADELLGEVETMVIMPDPAYYEHYHAQGREHGGGGREEPQKLLSKIEGIEARATTWCAPNLYAEAYHLSLM